MANTFIKAVVACGLAIVPAGFLFAGTNEDKKVSSRGEQCMISSYFSPFDNIEDVVSGLLEAAKTSVHCSLYGITNVRLTADLIALKAKGVDVEIGLDKTQAGGRNDKHSQLAKAGIRVVIKKTGVLEHNKFCVVDGDIVIMGSWNWSNGAQRQDNSDVVISHCKGQVARFEEAFQRIMKRDSAEETK